MPCYQRDAGDTGSRREGGKVVAKPMFKEAAAFVLSFGKYRGVTLDAIAVTDDGLKYLDWLRGERGGSKRDAALAAYLDDPAIKREVARVCGK